MCLFDIQFLTCLVVARAGFGRLEARAILNDPWNIFTVGERKHCFMDNAAGWSSHTLIAIAFAAIAVASGVCAGFDSARVLDGYCAHRRRGHEHCALSVGV